MDTNICLYCEKPLSPDACIYIERKIVCGKEQLDLHADDICSAQVAGSSSTNGSFCSRVCLEKEAAKTQVPFWATPSTSCSFRVQRAKAIASRAGLTSRLSLFSCRFNSAPSSPTALSPTHPCYSPTLQCYSPTAQCYSLTAQCYSPTEQRCSPTIQCRSPELSPLHEKTTDTTKIANDVLCQSPS